MSEATTSLPAFANPAVAEVIEKTACPPSCDYRPLQLYSMCVKNLGKGYVVGAKGLEPLTSRM